MRRTSVSGYSESSSSESYHITSAISEPPENHRRIDVNAAKNPAVHRDVGALNLALTVLRSCPLYDTIAILIVLLQIPPTFLSIIHLLFATLTFVPPSTSANSALSFTDIFEGTLGTPSVATIVVVDLVVLLVWLFLWGPLQDIALDLAQTVIALTLGGGTSGREAGMSNVLVCFGVVGVSHLARNGNVKQSGLQAVLSSSSRGFIGSPDPDDPLEPVSQNKKGPHGWIRSILAIHILTQGVVRYIRDWYVRREKRDTSASIGDPEAGKVAAENNEVTPNTQTPDNESSTSLPVSNTVVTTKKKRKQSAQVRIRQPLWAALASTKIVMVKEYETSHTAAESAGTNATDINNLGNAPFNIEADRIWITYVGSDEVFFGTSYFPTHTPENCEEKSVDSSGVDKSKPFFVRVNKTTWQPTRINATTDPGQQAGQDMRWSGEIFGLAPMSRYECDFVSTVDGAVIFSTRVRTLQPPTDVAAVGFSSNPQVSGRPGSPTTTLKTSIASSEVKLTEERNRQKRERKDQKTKLNTARKEIEKLISNIASSGGNDDKLRQKVQQAHLNQKQAEDTLNLLAVQIESLETIPTDESSTYTTSKRSFQSERDTYNQFRQDFQSAKEAFERDVAALGNEVTNLQQKRERMQSRIAKLNGEHERITDANARGIDEAQRKATDRQAKEAERAKMEMLLLERLHTINAQIDTNTTTLQTLFLSIQTYQQAEMYAAQQAQLSDSPTTSIPSLNMPFSIGASAVSDIPEGGLLASPGLAANYPWNAPPNTAGLYAPGYAMHLSLSGHRTRGRSSSMLSNVSGFTQSSGETPGMPHIQTSGFGSALGSVFKFGHSERKGSSGSGSGSGSGSAGPGSVGDPKSPTVGNAKVGGKWAGNGHEK